MIPGSRVSGPADDLRQFAAGARKFAAEHGRPVGKRRDSGSEPEPSSASGEILRLDCVAIGKSDEIQTQKNFDLRLNLVIFRWFAPFCA